MGTYCLGYAVLFQQYLTTYGGMIEKLVPFPLSAVVQSEPENVPLLVVLVVSPVEALVVDEVPEKVGVLFSVTAN